MPERDDRPIRSTSPVVEDAAIRLRRNQTAAEELLWDRLRNRQVWGLKFRRQHPVDTFVLDFYCSAIALAVELDGPIHDQQVSQDQYRTEQLNARGIIVLRFPNAAVFTALDDVIREITHVSEQQFRSRANTPP